ncbi:MAG: energy transducer TonB, partial [Flavobacteriales bacterium]
VKVKHAFYTDCDNEAIRVVSLMPNWKPGTKNGKPADVEMTLPIAFKTK